MAGEGIVQGSHTSGWTVTHDSCPRETVRHGHAQAYARRTVTTLRRHGLSASEAHEALQDLVRLLRTGWTTPRGFERVFLASAPVKNLDRLEAEELLERYLVQEGQHC